jgi:hypothetical protein
MKAMLVAIVVACSIIAAAPAMAQWVEEGDAGDMPATAQTPIGIGPLTTIAGYVGNAPGDSMESLNDADMYCIHIDDIALFSASVCGGAGWDSQLFLFQAGGAGVVINDDGCGLPSTESNLGSPTGCQHTGPGEYFLAITRWNKDPLDAGGGSIFTTGGGCADDGDPIDHWVDSWFIGGKYTITLTAASHCAGPTGTESSTWGTIKNLYR